MNDMRISARAFNPEEVEDLAAGGMGARNPGPVFDEILISNEGSLTWTPSDLATSQRLFLTRSYNEILYDETGGGSDLGEMIGGSFNLPDLAQGSYFWRIDSVERNGTVVRGEIWKFRLVPELLAHWRLDDPGGAVVEEEVLDRSNRVVGEPGMGSRGASARTGTSFDFTGADDHIEVPFSPELNLRQLTVSLWARVDGGSGTWRAAISSRTNPPHEGFSLYAKTSNVWSFWLGRGDERGWQQLSSLSPIIPGRWYHLAATYDGEFGRFYVDGSLVAAAMVDYVPNPRADLRIGGGGALEANYGFHGGIDEVKIWSRALSMVEIRNLGSYERWVEQAGVTFSKSGPHDVAGTNGFDNLTNYAMGWDLDGMAQSHSVLTDKGQLEFQLPRTLRSDISYLLEESESLEPGTWSEVAKVTAAGGAEIMSADLEVIDPAPGTGYKIRPVPGTEKARFLRMRLRLGDE
jgi:hypothetical protein